MMGIDLLRRLREGQALCAKINLEDASIYKEAADLIEALRDAMVALHKNEHLALGDMVYDVREREGKGWDGPAVQAWSDAVMKSQVLLQDEFRIKV